MFIPIATDYPKTAMRAPEVVALLFLVGSAAAAPRSLLDCAAADICKTHEGLTACPGETFYNPGCMPSTCQCGTGGVLKCERVAACATQCKSSGDCAAAVRTATAQPGLYPMCQCEARSTVGTIASRFDECLGEDTGAGRGCEYGRCANMCEGLTAICSSEGRCVLAEDGTEAEDAS